MDGGEWADEVSHENNADQRRAGGGGGEGEERIGIQRGRYFGKQPLSWPATETSTDPSSPARKQSEFHHF